MVLDHDNRMELLEESLDRLEEKKKDNDIYFAGQIYDAYSKLLDIFNESKKELIIIDPYADKNLLDIIKILVLRELLGNQCRRPNCRPEPRPPFPPYPPRPPFQR